MGREGCRNQLVTVERLYHLGYDEAADKLIVAGFGKQ
jgi:hypothetical protein